MKFLSTPIEGLYVIKLTRLEDNRGWFGRTYCKKVFAEHGIEHEFVQLNQSVNKLKGTFRGMHIQLPPHAEAKLVRCVSGAIDDFVIDFRKGSKTFNSVYHSVLSADPGDMLVIPKGLAHGFITKEDNTTVLYSHSAYYHPNAERGVRYDDPKISLKIPRKIEVISAKDQSYERLPDDFCGFDF